MASRSPAAAASSSAAATDGARRAVGVDGHGADLAGGVAPAAAQAAPEQQPGGDPGPDAEVDDVAAPDGGGGADRGHVDVVVHLDRGGDLLAEPGGELERLAAEAEVDGVADGPPLDVDEAGGAAAHGVEPVDGDVELVGQVLQDGEGRGEHRLAGPRGGGPAGRGDDRPGGARGDAPGVCAPPVPP